MGHDAASCGPYTPSGTVSSASYTLRWSKHVGQWVNTLQDPTSVLGTHRVAVLLHAIVPHASTAMAHHCTVWCPAMHRQSIAITAHDMPGIATPAHMHQRLAAAVCHTLTQRAVTMQAHVPQAGVGGGRHISSPWSGTLLPSCSTPVAPQQFLRAHARPPAPAAIQVLQCLTRGPSNPITQQQVLHERCPWLAAAPPCALQHMRCTHPQAVY